MCSHFGRTKDECKNLRLRLHGLCCPDPAIGRSKQHEQISEQFHPLTLLQQIRHRTFAKAMDTPPRNLMNAWCAWNAYHRKIIRDDPQDFDTNSSSEDFAKESVLIGKRSANCTQSTMRPGRCDFINVSEDSNVSSRQPNVLLGESINMLGGTWLRASTTTWNHTRIS